VAGETFHPLAFGEMAMKTIVEFAVVDHGITQPDYFQGCGVCGTGFEDVATGIGSNPAEAIDDALESLAQNSWDCDGMEKRILADIGKRKMPKTPRVRASDEDSYYHISIRVK
jgi:hypothetical protein